MGGSKDVGIRKCRDLAQSAFAQPLLPQYRPKAYKPFFPEARSWQPRSWVLGFLPRSGDLLAPVLSFLGVSKRKSGWPRAWVSGRLREPAQPRSAAHRCRWPPAGSGSGSLAGAVRTTPAPFPGPSRPPTRGKRSFRAQNRAPRPAPWPFLAFPPRRC